MEIGIGYGVKSIGGYMRFGDRDRVWSKENRGSTGGLEIGIS